MAYLPGMGAKTFYQIIKTFGCAANFFDAAYNNSPMLRGLQPELVSAARAACSKSRVTEILCELAEKRVSVITRLCEDYPAPLLRIPWSPAVLFVKGRLCDARRAIGIVGTRRCTRRGYELTHNISSCLGMPVVSGLARGIDTAAHTGALKANQPTTAVLGCGADIVYPPENTDVYQSIIENNGAVVSELPPGAAPFAANFPVRNRIIAGLARGLLVVESEEIGGTAITVSNAIGLGIDIFAVPGPPYIANSALPNMLIANGAVPVLGAADIKRHYGEESRAERKNAAPPPPLDLLQSRILELLKNEDRSAQAISDLTGMPAEQISAALTMLELSGAVRRIAGGKYGV